MQEGTSAQKLLAVDFIDESDDSEIGADMKGEEDDDSDEPLAAEQ
jgi:hypothetical protein